MRAYSLDTDIITKLLKKHPGNQRIVDRFREELRQNSPFVICPVVFYEIRRELVFKGAAAQLSAFEKLAEAMTWKESARASGTELPICGRPCEHEAAPTMMPMSSLLRTLWSTAQ